MPGSNLQINHRITPRYIHPTAPGRILARIRVYLDGAAPPQACYIRYDAGNGWQQEEMLLSVMTRDSLYYEKELTIPQSQLKYYFEVKSGDTMNFLGENSCDYTCRDPEEIVPFCYSWDPGEVFITPEWVREAVFYQIFPERFCNGNPLNDPENTVPWDSCPSPVNFFGGDLEGIELKIPYLVELGVTALWLTPVFTSISNHKYNTSDYMSIDPHFGDAAIFKRLVQKLHDNGIRIILDCVFNHTGTHFWAFEDILKNGTASLFKDWYYIREFPVRIEPQPTYECWWDVADLPKLKVSNPEVSTYLLDIAAYWTKEFGIDGWRLDVPNEIIHDFWIKFRKVVKSINPECYIVGEIWDDGRPWLQGDQFDAVMNYLFRDNVLDFFARRKMEVSDFDHHMGNLRLQYPQQVNLSLLNLMGSHDTARVLTVFKEETPHIFGPVDLEETKKRIRPAVIFQMTYPGAPMIYYGDEMGMAGGPDPGCRKAMVWKPEEQDRELLSFYSTLIRLRRENIPLTRGTFIPLAADNSSKLYAYARTFNDRLCLIILNLNSKDIECTVPVGILNVPEGTAFRDALSALTCTVQDNKIFLPMIEGNYGALLLPMEQL